MTSNYSKSVPGSAALKTRQRGTDVAIAAAESIEPGAMERIARGEDALGRVVIRGQFVPVLDQVFDSLAPAQTVVEQVLYLHLYRASYGHQRNFCRLTRSEICQRIGLSSRRFNHALAGLVSKGHVALLQRDRGGTLYRVFLPDEILQRRPGDSVLLGKIRMAQPSAVEKEKSVHVRGGGQDKPQLTKKKGFEKTDKNEHGSQVLTREGTSDRGQKMTPKKTKPQQDSVGSLARDLLSKVPQKMRDDLALDALQEVTDLMVEGHSLSDIAKAIARLPRLKGRRINLTEVLAQGMGKG